MIKLIASDLDGTLLQKGAQTVSRQAIELIEKLLDNGNPFYCCQRKTVQQLKELFAPFADRYFLYCQKRLSDVSTTARCFPGHP